MSVGKRSFNLCKSFCCLVTLLGSTLTSSAFADNLCDTLHHIIDLAPSRFNDLKGRFSSRDGSYYSPPNFGGSCSVDSDSMTYTCEWSYSEDNLDEARRAYETQKQELRACFPPPVRGRPHTNAAYDSSKLTFEDKIDNVEVSTEVDSYVSRRTGVKTYFVDLSVVAQ